MGRSTSNTLTPSSLNAQSRALLEDTFSQVWVEGELSGITRAASGHMYCTLKDERAQVQCALFRSHYQRLRFHPQEGMLVLARGRLTVYEVTGKYQLVLDTMEQAGEGALRRAFDMLRARLQEEGLLHEDRKKKLPVFPRRIAIITSPTGAVINDICSVFTRRFPLVAVDLLPTRVQGEGAAAQIIALLRKADLSMRYDVVLLARGGGSLEDLWTFNDEALVRQIANINTPIVSAIGHETDITLSDLAADARAATPSVAAQMVVPDATSLQNRITHAKERIQRQFDHVLYSAAQHVDQLYLRLQSHSPTEQLRLFVQRNAHCKIRLRQLQFHFLHSKQAYLHQLQLRLRAQHPQHKLAHLVQELQRIPLKKCMQQRLHAMQHHLGLFVRALESVSPLGTVARGYAIVTYPKTGKIVRDARILAPKEGLRIQFAYGQCDVEVSTVYRTPPPFFTNADS